MGYSSCLHPRYLLVAGRLDISFLYYIRVHAYLPPCSSVVWCILENFWHSFLFLGVSSIWVVISLIAWSDGCISFTAVSMFHIFHIYFPFGAMVESMRECVKHLYMAGQIYLTELVMSVSFVDSVYPAVESQRQ